MRIGIIGGGITGLTTAIALGKKGFNVAVREQAPALNEIGAGVWLQPNAIKILTSLGLTHNARQVGIELQRVEITRSDLAPIKRIKGQIVEDEQGNKTIAIHRARLQKVLYDAALEVADVQLNKVYKTHQESEDGVQVQFQDGQETFDVLLAADGVHSAVRQHLFSNASLRDSGQMCWRGIANMQLPEELRQLGREAWGNKVRFGFSQIGENETYWFAVALEKDTQQVSSKDQVRGLFTSFHPIIAQMIDHTSDSAIHQTVLKDLKRIDSWHVGNVCLLGDAAHATTPNMGQGACQGMEDAYHLARLLEQTSTPVEVFEQFTLLRRKKVDYVVNNSWRFGQMAHSPFGQAILKMMMKLTPEQIMNSQMKKLYALE